MTDISEHPLMQEVKYSNFKNDVDEQASVTFIPPISEGNKSSKIRGATTFNFKPSLKIIGIFAVTIIFIVITCTFIMIKSPTLSSNCVPLKNVEKVILMNARTSNALWDKYGRYICSDNATCQMMLRNIEEDYNGSQYNFAVSPEGDLYVGVGFKCLMKNSETALYIMYIEENRQLPEKQCSRISEVIDEGIACGYISENHTLVYKVPDSDSEKVIDESYRYFECILKRQIKEDRPRHFHDPDHEMRTLIYDYFKWTVCGNYSHTSKVNKSRVITLESLPKSSCLPLKDVTDILVDVVQLDYHYENCFNFTFTKVYFECTHVFEELYEGLKYNFIIGYYNEVYVGLGYKCYAENNSSNVLRIKVLNHPNDTEHTLQIKYRKYVQILEEGIACGNVLEHFSVKSTCHTLNTLCDFAKMDFNGKEELDNAEYSKSYMFEEGHCQISSKHGSGVVHEEYRIHSCNRNHKTEQTTDTPESTSSTPPHNYDDYDIFGTAMDYVHCYS